MRIDLNADLGETWGNRSTADDDALLDVVTSANIACGFHAGDAETMARTVAGALRRGVTVGAHVSYRDRENFGRRFIDVPPVELQADITEQLVALTAACAAAGARLAYVKPHGALYHAVCTRTGQAKALVSGIIAHDPSLQLLGLPDTVATRLAAEAGLTTVAEAFADRAYTRAGGLVPRDTDGAVLRDPDLVADRMLQLATTGAVEAIDGTLVAVAARSICVHGDSPGAVTMARSVRTRLEAAGLTLAPFA